MAQTEKFGTIFESLDAFRAATEPGFRKGARSPDPLERFHVTGPFWNGRIHVQPDGRALPEVVTLKSLVEAKQKARAGWLPLRDRDGQCPLPAKIRELFAAFFKDGKQHDGTAAPAAIVDVFPEKPAPAAAPEKPDPKKPG